MMKLKFKERPLVVCNYRVGIVVLILISYCFQLFVGFVIVRTQGLDSYTIPIILFILLVNIWAVLRSPPQFVIYPSGLHIYRFRYSQFLSWDELTCVKETKLLFPSYREIQIISTFFPKYMLLSGYSVDYHCPRVYLKESLHHNFDKACEILRHKIETGDIKAKSKR